MTPLRATLALNLALIRCVIGTILRLRRRALTLQTTAALTTGRTEQDIAAEIGNDGAGALKRYVTESVNAYLAPIRERRRELEGQPEMVREILHEGNRRANEIANTTLDEVREAMGMVY